MTEVRARFVDRDGSIFDSGADVLVCPVNCVGVMGAGLALAFKQRFDGLFDEYAAFCKAKVIQVGRTAAVGSVVLFPTKGHWRNPSTLTIVEGGLRHLAYMLGETFAVAQMARRRHPWRSIAIPALGCGLGGLRWEDVRPLIIEALSPIEIEVLLYAPKEGEA